MKKSLSITDVNSVLRLAEAYYDYFQFLITIPFPKFADVLKLEATYDAFFASIHFASVFSEGVFPSVSSHNRYLVLESCLPDMMKSLDSVRLSVYNKDLFKNV